MIIARALVQVQVKLKKITYGESISLTTSKSLRVWYF